MVRKGRFALFNGEEYELISYRQKYYLKSEDELDLQSGFIKTGNNDEIFIKQVSVSDLQDAYEIFPYAMIDSYRFSVGGYNEELGIVSLVTNNPFVQGKIDVHPYGKDGYILEMPLEAIHIQEDRMPILGFENRSHNQMWAMQQ